MSTDSTALGDRMKGYEEAARYVLPRRTYTVIRCDGKAFHSYLRGAEKPFDARFMANMDAWDWTLDIEPWARETGRMPTMNMPEQAPDPSEQPGWDVRDDITAFYRALSPEQVMDGIAKAVKAHDFEAVNALLRVLAVKDPHQAELVYGSMLAVLGVAP